MATQNKDQIEKLYKNIDQMVQFLRDSLKNITVESIKPINDLSIDAPSDDKLQKLRLDIFKLLEENKQLELYEKNEIKTPKNNTVYKIIIGDNDIKIKLFCLYTILFAFETKVRSRILKGYQKVVNVGIDYEFNNRQIALMQINFESASHKTEKTTSYIWLVNPGEFDDKQSKILTKYLMTNRKIYKILHGADSLDIPYMYQHLFKNDKETIIKFTKKMYDTRFLCEYFRLSKDEERKCSIYDALKYFGTVTTDKRDELEEIHDSMGPVQDISWNIHKMSSFHIKYALYDVLFLEHYLFNIFGMVSEDTPKYKPSYIYANELIRFVLLERREVITVVEELKNLINPINNFMVKSKGENKTLVSIYNQIIEGFVINTPEGDVYTDFILLVPFLKKTISFLFKGIVYHVITSKHTVYKKKDEKLEEPMKVDILFSSLKDLTFDKTLELLKLFKDQIKF